MVYTSTKLRAAEPVLREVAQRIRRAPGQHVVKPSIRFPEPVKRGGSVQSSAWWSSRERDSIVAAVLNVLNTSNLRTQSRAVDSKNNALNPDKSKVRKSGPWSNR